MKCVVKFSVDIWLIKIICSVTIIYLIRLNNTHAIHEDIPGDNSINTYNMLLVYKIIYQSISPNKMNDIR